MKFRRLVIAPLLLAAAISCSDTTSTITDQLNLDRPIDIAFACYGGLRLTGGGAADVTQPIIQTAMPIEACNIRSETSGSGSGSTARSDGRRRITASSYRPNSLYAMPRL